MKQPLSLRAFLTAVLFLVSSTAVLAQAPTAPEVPEPDPADVESVDAILTALYDVISGPAGERDWDRLWSLFHPRANLGMVVRNQQGDFLAKYWTTAEYQEQVGQFYMQNDFYETEIHRTEEAFGHVLHAFSTYESRRDPEGEVLMRGINSFQLMHDGNRWWLINAFWDNENPNQPIPERYLPKQ